MALLRKALIQCSKNNMTHGEVIGVTEVSEKGFGKLSGAADQIYWDCTQWAVSPGDIWVDGVFYSAADPKTPVAYIPSTEEKLAKVESDLNDKDLDNKMAIAEVYEMMLGGASV